VAMPCAMVLAHEFCMACQGLLTRKVLPSMIAKLAKQLPRMQLHTSYNLLMQ